MPKEKMTEEDREYFKAGIKSLCGAELVSAGHFINDKDMRKCFDKSDLAFMNKEIGKQAGAIWAKLLRALKKKDYREAETIIRGQEAKENENDSDY